MQSPRVLPATPVFRLAGRRPAPRRFAAGLTAAAAVAALVLSTSLPARAGDGNGGKDAARALVAALVIGAILQGAKKAGDAAPVPLPVPVPVPVPVHDSHDHMRKPHRDDRPVIPRVCAIEIEGDRRDIALYPETCLRDAGVGGPLPRDCATRATIFGQPDRVYGADCLRDAGFRLRGGW